MFLTVATGLGTGAVLGFVLQKGGFCMNTAFRSIIFERDHSMLRAWVLILLINMVALNLLEQFYVIFPLRAPFAWPALLVGGLVFGLGMVFAGGCVSGTYYRVGKGMIGSFAALIGFAAAATAVSVGVLRPALDFLRQTELEIAGEPPALFHLLPIDPFVSRWIVTAVLGGAAVVWLLKAPKQRFAIGWKWFPTSLAIAAISILAWYFSSLQGRDYGLSFTQPTISLVRWGLFADGGGINWATFMVLGVVVGATIAAIADREFSLRLPAPGRLVQQFCGGLLMGFGAAVAGGCNIGHGISGISVMSISSMFATVCTMAGVWLGTWIVFRVAKSQQGV